MAIKNVTVLGAGVLGAQIALVTAKQGFNVVTWDINDEALPAASKRFDTFGGQMIDELPDVTEESMAAARGRLRLTSDLEDAVREADSGGRIKAASQTEVRSNAMTAQAEEKLADLQAKKEAAEAAGDSARTKKLDKEIDSAQSMLEMIRRSAASL